MNGNNRVWICSKCKRVYPHTQGYCQKCNTSKKHALRFVDSFIRKEDKIKVMKTKHEKFVNNYKKIQERHKR